MKNRVYWVRPGPTEKTSPGEQPRTSFIHHPVQALECHSLPATRGGGVEEAAPRSLNITTVPRLKTAKRKWQNRGTQVQGLLGLLLPDLSNRPATGGFNPPPPAHLKQITLIAHAADRLQRHFRWPFLCLSRVAHNALGQQKSSPGASSGLFRLPLHAHPRGRGGGEDWVWQTEL